MMEKTKFRVLLVYPNLSMMLTPSYSVGLFTAILKREGYDFEFFDCTPYMSNLEFLGEPLPVTRANKMLNSRKFDAKTLFGDPKTNLKEDFSERLEAFHPHAVIFSTVVEDTWPQVTELLEVMHSYPHIRHIVGGVFTIMAPNHVISHPHIECIGIGEGEEVILEFCEAVRAGIKPHYIKGTWAKTCKGKIIRNPSRPLVNVNRVLPDFSFFDERRFYRPLGAKIWKTIPMETYRGCPYTCTFCNSPAQVVIARENKQGYYLRRKSMDVIRTEIQMMIDRYQMEFLYINDDAFMARPREELLKFAKMYETFKIPFWFQTRFEDITDEKLEALARAGCYRISFGLEHGDETYRKEKLFRNISNEKILKQAKVAGASGIPYTLNNIVGFPYETRELLLETINLNREIASFDSLSVNIFVPYRGTVLREMAIKEGWLDPTAQTTSVIAESILKMPLPFLSGKEILGLQRVFPLYVRMPTSQYDQIRRAESFDVEGNKIFDVLANDFYEMTYGKNESDRMLTYQG